MGEETNDLMFHEPEIAEILDNIVAATHLEVAFKVVHHAGSVPELTVEFFGPDSSLLTTRNGELLRAFEHLVSKMIGLEPDQHDLLSFDANQFKLKRDRALRELAREAAEKVKETSRPFTFAPMSSHERRLLHLAFTTMGLRTASTGEGSQRAVVLYPPGSDSSVPLSARNDGRRQ
ncbi:protein jag [Granulicella sibirica]|uniref:RNA-binding protein Jag n=1 Tax=Granulicella sibirica TaxID=2479048 RepID=A0A4Q0T415_9BACT|nr:R3H domain-containing nucleic acid-binding protein [Granulicella sibirica]RXH58465.1 RNA-binding protein Jag [Granulicella sibirica]